MYDKILSHPSKTGSIITREATADVHEQRSSSSSSVCRAECRAADGQTHFNPLCQSPQSGTLLLCAKLFAKIVQIFIRFKKLFL